MVIPPRGTSSYGLLNKSKRIVLYYGFLQWWAKANCPGARDADKIR